MGYIRVQFETSRAKIKAIEALMRQCGVRTKKEFFNNAITFLEWVAEQVKLGRIVVSMNEEKGKYKELLMPWMSNVKKDQ
jgi:hypothetical protein